MPLRDQSDYPDRGLNVDANYIAALTQRNAELEAEVERLKRCGNCNGWQFDPFAPPTRRCMALPVNGEWPAVQEGDSCHHDPSRWEHIYDAAHAPDEGGEGCPYDPPVGTDFLS
jgi:hypothetical protein